MPDGFLAPRGNLLIDVIFLCNLLAPVWALVAARAARRGEYVRHMRLQLSLWLLMLVALFALEGYIRVSGGSGSLTDGSPHAGTALFRTIFALHIIPAMATYVLWAWLIVVTYRRRNAPALAGFAARHARFGKVVIGGLIWTALSAAVVYYLSFWA